MTTTARQPINWTYLLVKTIVTAFMVGAAAISFSHIVDISRTLGLGWEAWTVPFAIDGLAILGLVGRGRRFAASTQRAGLKFMAGAGTLSLAANVAAGDNLGQRLYGVLVVAGFIAAEWYSTQLRPAPVPPPTATDEQREKRSEAARKAAATRKANKETADKLARKAARDARRVEREALEAAYAAPAAPVSPAPYGS